MRRPFEWYDHNADNPPFLKALAEVRELAPLEGCCYQHVQAIMVSIDQYAEAALGGPSAPSSPDGTLCCKQTKKLSPYTQAGDGFFAVSSAAAKLTSRLPEFGKLSAKRGIGSHRARSLG